MKNLTSQYKTWGDASINAWCRKDIDIHLSLMTEDCTYLAIDPFDENETLRGHTTIRNYLQSYSTIKDACLLKNNILSANSERGIGNARVSWKSEDGKTWACDFI